MFLLRLVCQMTFAVKYKFYFLNLKYILVCYNNGTVLLVKVMTDELWCILYLYITGFQTCVLIGWSVQARQDTCVISQGLMSMKLKRREFSVSV